MRIDRNKVLKGSYMMKLILLISGLVSAVGIELGIGTACLVALFHARAIKTDYTSTRRAS